MTMHQAFERLDTLMRRGDIVGAAAFVERVSLVSVRAGMALQMDVEGRAAPGTVAADVLDLLS